MKDLSHDAKSLFANARQGLSPNPADQARVERALTTRLGLVASTIVGTAAVTSGASAAANATIAGAGAAASATAAGAGVAASMSNVGLVTLGVVAKWMGIGAALGFGTMTTLGVLATPHRTQNTPLPRASTVIMQTAAKRVTPPRPVLETREPIEMAPTEAPSIEAAPIEGTPTKDARDVAVPAIASAAQAQLSNAQVAIGTETSPSDALSAPVDQASATAMQSTATVAREANLLRLAVQARRGGDANRALQFLNEHASLFPHSILAEERSIELVLTLCQLGQIEAAHSEAERFLRRAPDSLLVDNLKSSCVGVR